MLFSYFALVILPGFAYYWTTVCKSVRPVLSDRCPVLSVLSVCNVGVLWPNGWTDQDETLHAGIGLGPGHIVLDGDPLHVYCGETVAHLSYCWALVLYLFHSDGVRIATECMATVDSMHRTWYSRRKLNTISGIDDIRLLNRWMLWWRNNHHAVTQSCGWSNISRP